MDDVEKLFTIIKQNQQLIESIKSEVKQTDSEIEKLKNVSTKEN